MAEDKGQDGANGGRSLVGSNGHGIIRLRRAQNGSIAWRKGGMDRAQAPLKGS
jgi:hypothetical protein